MSTDEKGIFVEEAMNTQQTVSSSLSVGISAPSVANALFPLPAPRGGEITIRVATMEDLPFLDALQKQHSKQLGYFPTKQFEGYIKMGGVLIAEERRGLGLGAGLGLGDRATPNLNPDLHPNPSATPVGYVISRDRYLKRDELGVIYQLCVVPGEQRKLVGASLVKAVFERSAYGCRLYCCWCAQDIAANYFWESLGFVPVAFRAGSTGKKRVHIFWQKRICEGDETTPYWYPFQTNSGAIREDRLVFPIPPGTHWKEVQAVAVPREELPIVSCQLPGEQKKPRQRTRDNGQRTQSAMPASISRVSGLRFAAPVEEKPVEKKREKEPEQRRRIDPKYLTAARELRDRYMEQINSDPRALLPQGKYDVARVLEASRRAPLLQQIAA